MTIIPFPKRSRRDYKDARVRPWLGQLFENLIIPLMWKDKSYEMMRPPNSVTFPICAGCGHIIWDWPHYEEEVPKDCVCDDCAEDWNE